MPEMIRERLLKTIQKFRMIEKGETVFVGVSGGADSVALLHLLSELRSPWKLKLGILHVNHKLRGRASDADQVFVRRLGRKLKVPVYVGQLPIKTRAKAAKMSIEEAAREGRYHFFEKTAKAKGAGKIALAHSQDDQAETVLMRILTGTGLQGLRAIRPKRKLNETYLVRPLIEIPRADIRKFARENSIRFREDASNRSLQYVRNRIRLKLLPFLERAFNPQVKKALARLPHLLDVDLSFLDETAEIFYKRLASQNRVGEIVFPKASFLELGPALQYRLLGRALRRLAGSELDYDHWNLFLDQLASGRSFRLQFPKGLFVSVSADSVKVKRANQSGAAFSYPLGLGRSLYLSEIDKTISCKPVRKKIRMVRKSNKAFELFDGAKLAFPLGVRSRRAGDRFQPLGQPGFLKLKGYLINKRISAEDRDRLPLVVSGDRIAWVGGVGLGEAFKITPETKRVVRISLSPGNFT